MTATTASATRLADARFIDLVTFRRTGQPVGTPVIFVQDGDRLLVRTAKTSGKLKRIAHTARVELTPADSKGRHCGDTVTGTARILDADAVRPTLARLHARYRIAGPLFSFVRRLRRQDDVIIEIALDQPASAMSEASMIAAAAVVSRRIAATGVRTACLVFAMAILVAACGGQADTVQSDAAVADIALAEPADTDTGDGRGLCLIFTPEQAQAVLGEPVGPGIAKTSITFGSQSCRYTSTTSHASTSLWLHEVSFRDDWDEQAATLGLTADDAVPSIGEAAYRSGGSVEHPRAKVTVFDAGHDFWLDLDDAADPVRAADALVAVAAELATALR